MVKGALLATEAIERPEPEVALVRPVAYAPLTPRSFDRYAEDTIATLRAQKRDPQLIEKEMLQGSELSQSPFGKVSIRRI